MKPSSPWWGETRSRHHWAATMVRGARVVVVERERSGAGPRILAEAGADEVIAVSAAPARGAAHRDVVWVTAGSTAIPLPDEDAALVVAFDALQHDEPGAALAELARVTRPGGRVLLSAPSRTWEQATGRRASPDGARAWTASEIAAVAARHLATVEVLGQVVRSGFPRDPHFDHPARDRERSRSADALGHLPFGVRDRISRLTHNRPFHPGEYDFDFDPSTVDVAHALVAVGTR